MTYVFADYFGHHFEVSTLDTFLVKVWDLHMNRDDCNEREMENTGATITVACG